MLTVMTVQWQNNILLQFMMLFLLIMSESGCVHIAGPRYGTIVEEKSGLPIKDAIVVRTWDHRQFSPGGEAPFLYEVSEKFSNADGKYIFYPRVVPYISFCIPFIYFSFMDEGDLFIYKPGYYHVSFRRDETVFDPIRLQKVPDEYYLRKAEHETVRSNYALDVYKTELLKHALLQEERAIAQKDKYAKGVFYQPMRNAGDIDFDNDGNILITAQNYLYKISDTGERQLGEPLSGDLYSTDIEFDSQNVLYALNKINFKAIKPDGSRYIKKLAIPPYTDSRFAISSDQNLFVVMTNRMYVLHEDGSLQCQMDVESALNLKGRHVLVRDVTAYGTNSALIAYSLGKFSPGLLWVDSNCHVRMNKQVNIDSAIVSLTALPSQQVVASLENRFIVFDPAFKIIFEEDLMGTVLGPVKLSRVKADRAGKKIYFIDSEEPRLLRYELDSKKWYQRKTAAISPTPTAEQPVVNPPVTTTSGAIINQSNKATRRIEK